VSFFVKYGGAMKKIILIFFVLLAMSFTVTADEYNGVGLSLGLEVGIENLNKVNEEDRAPYIMPRIIYDRSFLDGAFDVFTELDYKFGYTKVLDGNKEVFPQSVYFDLLFGYHMPLGGASTLSFFLENEFDEIDIAPVNKKEKETNITGIFTPAVGFSQEFDFGDIYARVGSPITYIQDEKNADKIIGLDCTLGWYSIFGLGLQAKARTQLVPGYDRGYLGLEVLASYEMDDMYFEIFAEIPKDISEEGVTITPEFEYYFKSFTFYTYCEFSSIGAGGSVIISPAIGVKFSF
jgi:hypothetical protein